MMKEMMQEMVKGMKQEMMQQCCGSDGKPDIDKMKRFMEQRGKVEFSNANLQMMQQICTQKGMPDMAKMKQMMEAYGYNFPESAQAE